VIGFYSNSKSDYTIWTLYRSYYKGISANIEVQVHTWRDVDRTYVFELVLVNF
jgi:hypothetical protein